MIDYLDELAVAKRRYREYVENFDPTPQYLYDEPYSLLDFNEWLDEVYGL